jgi:hypothetical protein
MKRIAIVFLLMLGTTLFATETLNEQQKIDFLISVIRNLKGATFIRNGSEHTPQEAADHLQMKREKAGSRLQTAQDFIDKIATKSSLSRERYMIRFANGKMYPCQMVLNNELRKLEDKK